jgi:23S rRNA (adenine2503-C2)-methyltransferase
MHEMTKTFSPTLVTTQASPNGKTRKDLLRMADGHEVETVLLHYRHRYAVCLSTQVGCPCGCRFCATGQMGFVRNLTADEIIAQVQHFQRQLGDQRERLANLVFMGMGEPLLNTDAVLDAVRSLVDPRGFAFAPRRVTLSTVGIPAGIRRLAGVHHQLPIKLAISLHAATDDLRDHLMPINTRHPLGQLLDAIETYVAQTGRRVLFEWVMVDGVNDTAEQAHALAHRLEDLPAHVNLIRLNPTTTYDGKPSPPHAVDAFVDILEDYQIPHTMRQRRGDAIQAGCGQLKSRHSSPAPTP